LSIFLSIDLPTPLLTAPFRWRVSLVPISMGLRSVYQSLNPWMGPEASAVAVATQYETGVEQAASALDQFEIAARHMGVSHGARRLFNVSYAETQSLSELSRLYDLNIVIQPDRSRLSHGDMLPEIVLFNSGRPMLMVPYIYRGPLKLDRMLICWDGGRPAARAVHDAMPLLLKAEAIDVLTVNEDKAPMGEASSAALIAHLARHDLTARLHRFTADASNIHNSILSLAADNSTDLIVMGGYGHSKFREFILGGVTRGIFESLTVPALISH
jgi:nucleotide-binding universal stress UspA family protein